MPFFKKSKTLAIKEETKKEYLHKEKFTVSLFLTLGYKFWRKSVTYWWKIDFH
jgi:hypothetical protein